MIRIARTAKPLVLQKNEAKWLDKLRDARASHDKTKFERAQSKYKHKAIKDALKAMFNGKCAFCENTIEAVAYAHIEHFRPKSRYISLTFAWENLYLSCPMCNGKDFKGNLFPKIKDGGPFIDPCAEDPGLHFAFEYDRASDLAIVRPLTLRGGTTVDIFGLNTRKELLKARTTYLKKLVVLKTYEATDPQAAALLKQARLATEPFNAWANALL